MYVDVLITTYRLLLLLILIKEDGSARLRESDIHPLSLKTRTAQYQPIDIKKRKGRDRVDYSRDRAAYVNKKALALLLKPANPIPSNTGLARLFQWDTESGTKVLWYSEVLRRGEA